MRTTCASARKSSRATADTYRKLRNTIRWMLGSLAHFSVNDAVSRDEMPELERLMLHRLAELDAVVREAYAGVRL